MSSSYLLLGLIQDGPVSPRLRDHAQEACIEFEVIQSDALAYMRVSDWPAVVVGAHADQIALMRQRTGLVCYLNEGGLVIWNGAVAHPPLPELKVFEPLPERTLTHLRVTQLQAHPVFDKVPTDALTFRKGVAGFWGRGHNPPPSGSTLIHGLGPQPQGHPVDWYWPRRAGGAVLMHAGNDLFSYADDTELRKRILTNLRDWVVSHQRRGQEEEMSVQ